MTYTKERIRRLVRDLAKYYPKQSPGQIAKKHKVKLKYLGEGINRRGYLVVGTCIVLKISENSYQSKRELANIFKFRESKRLRPYLPKIYNYGCSINSCNTSIIAMHYYPRRPTLRDCEKIEELFEDLSDIHSSNVRKSKTGKIKLIDLGI